MTKKNITFISISLVLTLLLGIGVSYSMWNITVNQDTVSTMHTDCFELTISNKESNISLENAYPISNSKGMKLTPYTFTVTNTCDITAQYSINLEVLKGSTLSSEFIDVMLDGNINLLSNYDETDKIDNTSIESRKIDTGILKSNESKDYSLRLWIDYDTTLEDLNNETKVFKSKVTIVGKPINYTGDTVFNFDYTGGEQIFTAPVSGTYKLETWGSQGGSGVNKGTEDGYNNYYLREGGYGGYSSGILELEKNSKEFINVGGGGTTLLDVSSQNKTISSGYNGGGAGFVYANGGGATHIASKSGLLSTLENYKSDILIVSGGGAGTAAHIEGGGSCFGGSGGGYKGNDGTNGNTLYGTPNPNFFKLQPGVGANQLSGYSFGIGESANSSHSNSGSGGGFYGGKNSIPKNSWNSCGGGGSGYIGNSLLKDKVMYCYNCEESSDERTKTISTTCSEETPTSYCSKKGNGYARITLVSIDE